MRNIKIGKAFSIIRNGATIKQDKVVDGIPITRIETIADGTVDLNRLGYASVKDDEFKEYYLQDGDILMSHINSVSHLGKVAIFENRKEKIIHGMNLLCLKANPEILVPKYAFLYLKSSQFRSIIKKITKKSVNQASFNISNLKELEIPVPENISDQLHIANLLSKAENLIAQRKESIRLLDEFLKSTFLEMFGDPVRNEMGWNIGKFKDLAILDRKQVLPSDFTKEDFYIGLEDIEKETGNIIKTSSENAEDLKSSKFRFTPNHILYAKLRPYLNKAALPYQTGICSTDIFPVLPLEGKSNRFFICYLMRSKPFVTEMHSKSSGANLPRASASVIENFKTYQPPIELQTQFAQIFSTTEALKKQFQQSLQELENLYGSLSQRAFKGELATKGQEQKTVVPIKQEAKIVQSELTKQQAFLRKLMLASHIVYELCEEPTFGHTKLMKLLYLCEQAGGMALQTNYKKFAAGPFDGKTLTLIDKEFAKNKWFTIEKKSFAIGGQKREATVYKKTEKSLSYKKHFENYFASEADTINRLIALFRKEKTQTTEIVATLYFAWNELKAAKTIISDNALIEGFYKFHPEKKKFTPEQIITGYKYMQTNELYPEYI